MLRRLRAWSGQGIHRRPRPPERPSKRTGLRSIGLSRGVRASARRLERAHCAAGGWLCNSAAGCSPTSTHMRGRTAAHVRAHRTALHRHTRPHSHTHARGTRTELRGGPRFPFVHLAAGEPDTSAVLTTARPRPPWSPAHPEAPRQAPAAGLTSPFAHAHFAPPLAPERIERKASATRAGVRGATKREGRWEGIQSAWEARARAREGRIANGESARARGPRARAVPTPPPPRASRCNAHMLKEHARAHVRCQEALQPLLHPLDQQAPGPGQRPVWILEKISTGPYCLPLVVLTSL